jgi:hypothetical protein
LDELQRETPPVLEGAQGFLGALYSLAGGGDIHRAAERVVDFMDDLLNGDRFDECDQVLNEADVDQLVRGTDDPSDR